MNDKVSDGARGRPLAARDAQAVLLEQLLGDVDALVTRVERFVPELDAAVERFERAAQAGQAAFAANAEAAKVSVGEWITAKTNEATARALKEHLQAVDEAVAASLGRGVLAAAERARHQAAAAPVPAESSGRLWMAAAAGAGVMALAVMGFWLVLGGR